MSSPNYYDSSPSCSTATSPVPCENCKICSLLCVNLEKCFNWMCCAGSQKKTNDTYYREMANLETKRMGDSPPDDSLNLEIEIDSPPISQDSNAVIDLDEICNKASIKCGHSRSKTSAPQKSELEVSLPEADDDSTLTTEPADQAEKVQLAEEVLRALEASDDLSKTEDTLGETRPLERFHSLQKRRKKSLATRSINSEPALLDDLLCGQVQRMMTLLSTWSFDAAVLDNVAGGRGLPMMCLYLFENFGLLSQFHIDPAKAWKLFSLFEENYHNTNSYHNCVHAIDVTQAMACFLRQNQIAKYLEPIEVMAGILAAIAHDLDHPGVNQPFLVATNNHLASLYESVSVLENHHWRTAISCMIESEIFDEMPEYPRLKELMRSLILATDITRQQHYLAQFKVYLDTNTLDLTRADHRQLVLQIALKCADISNPCRPWEISQAWSLKVCEEFFRQGDMERQLSMTMTPLCDRYVTCVPKIQMGFFQYVVMPLITEWHRFLNNDLSETMLKNLVTNLKLWSSFSKDENNTETESDDLKLADNISSSSERLLPQRRCSLNPLQAATVFREKLRRFSAPLNMLRVIKPRDKSAQVFDGSHSTDIAYGEEKLLKIEKLVPETTIALITTHYDAQKIVGLFEDKVPGKPDQQVARATRPKSLSLSQKPYLRYIKSDFGLKFVSSPTKKANSLLQQDIKSNRRLIDNLTAWHREFSIRRKSMPTVALSPQGGSSERHDLKDVNQLFARSPLGRSGRRGSAPVGESRSVNESSQRRSSEQGTRTQRAWLFSTRPQPLAPLTRRSSLPAEVMTGIPAP